MSKDGALYNVQSRSEQRQDPSVYASSARHQLITALDSLKQRLNTIDQSLDRTVESQDDLSRQIARLDLSRARLGSLNNVARSLQKIQLAPAASTAARISSAVNALDVEQSRVRATLAVVEQVATLKSCIMGCVGSMGAPQDWETAASYLHRASEIPQQVITCGFAESIVPTAEAPDPPAVTLESCRESLCGLFLKEFEGATKVGDGGKVTRFFKMFPLIGRTQVGLDAYGRYVCQGVAARARDRMRSINGLLSGKPDGGLSFANALTKLFEHVAQVVDAHTPLVERHYGRGTMLVVIERLHREIDVQGGIILDTWYDERKIEKRLTEVKSYAFSFLVQSFLNLPRAGTSTPRSASPAPGRKQQLQESDETIDMRDIDALMNEITIMLRHWSLYLRFVSAQAVYPNEDSHGELDLKPLNVPQFLSDSVLPRKVQKTLIESFSDFSTFFLRRSIEKAFQMDELPTGLSLNGSKLSNRNTPYITSAVDDVMYIVNQVLQRSMATSQTLIVNSALSNVGRVLGSDFVGMIQRKLRDEAYPKPAVQGGVPPEDKVVLFLILINNLDVSVDYIKRIINSCLNPGSERHESSVSRTLEDLFPIDNQASTVRNAMNGLQSSFTSKAGELVGDGLAVAFSQIMQPRIRPLAADVFRDVDYLNIGETSAVHHDGHGDGEEEEDDLDRTQALVSRFKDGWSGVTLPITRLLTERNREKIMKTATTYLSSLLEKRIWSYQGRANEEGAVRMEKHIVGIISSALQGEPFRLRDVFTRCTQILTIMNMEDEEWDDLHKLTDADAIQDGWVLNQQDRLRARIVVKGRA